jgi:hypothetical protein
MQYLHLSVARTLCQSRYHAQIMPMTHGLRPDLIGSKIAALSKSSRLQTSKDRVVTEFGEPLSEQLLDALGTRKNFAVDQVQNTGQRHVFAKAIPGGSLIGGSGRILVQDFYHDVHLLT